MAISSGFVQLPDDSGNAGKKEDHIVLSGGNYREVVSIGDPDSTGIAKVAPVSATLGLAVEPKALAPGASTAAKQPALGTAGTASADVISVQGIASMTPLLATGTGSAGTAATGVVTVQGIASMTKLLVTPDSVALPANQSVNVAQMNGVTTSMGSGANGTGVQRVTVATDDGVQTKLSALINPGLSVAVSVTRPSNTTAYAANDVLGPTGGGTAGIDFNLAAVSASNIMITSASLERDVSALVSGESSYNLYLYNITPPSALVDNDPFDLPSGDRASFLGVINLGTPVDQGSTLYIGTDGINKQVKLAGTHIFGYLVTVGAYTPASATVLKVTLNAVQL
jgi:hypothetical protein